MDIPREISRANAHDVKVVWGDGHESVYLSRALRLACACAACTDEFTGQKRLHEGDVPQDVKPLAITAVGRYAVHVRWSDGHATGLYTFDYLRGLCSCAACRSKN